MQTTESNGSVFNGKSSKTGTLIKQSELFLKVTNLGVIRFLVPFRVTNMGILN